MRDQAEDVVLVLRFLLPMELMSKWSTGFAIWLGKETEEILPFQARSAESTNHTIDSNSLRVCYLLIKIEKWKRRKEKNLSVISVWIEVETFSQNLWADEKSVYHDCCDFCRHKQMCYFVGDRVKNQMLLQTAHFKTRQNAMKSQLPLIVWISLRQIFCQVYTSWKII